MQMLKKNDEQSNFYTIKETQTINRQSCHQYTHYWGLRNERETKTKEEEEKEILLELV